MARCQPSSSRSVHSKSWVSKRTPQMAKSQQDETKASIAWQKTLQQQDDPVQREWLCVTRRYATKVLPSHDSTVAKHVQVSLQCSDRDLPAPVRMNPLQIHLQIATTYPQTPLDCSLPMDLNGFLHDDQRQRVEAALNLRAKELVGTLSMRKLLTWLDNYLSPLIVVSDTDQEQPQQQKDLYQSKEQEQVEAEADQQRTRRRPCHFFRRGKCSHGTNCRFSHDLKPNSVTSAIKQQQQTESGAKLDEIQPPDNAAKDQVKKTRSCKFFAKKRCKLGSKCPFLHDKRSSVENKTSDNTTPVQAEKESESGPQEQVQIGVPSINHKNKETKASKEVSKSSDAEPPIPNEWSLDQQRALDDALKRFPASMDKKERWQSIGKAVDGKTLNDCIDRFKFLCKIVQQGSPAAVTHPSKQKSGCSSQHGSTSDHDIDTNPDQDDRERENEIQDQDNEAKNGESESSVDPSVDQRILAQNKRVAVELDPVVKGIEIRLQELFLYQVGTVLPQTLLVQLECSNCPYQFDHRFRLDCSSSQKWCPRCSVLHSVGFHAIFAHESSNLCAYLDCDNCSVRDILPSDFLVTCLECGQESLLASVRRGIRAENWCRSCHKKLALQAKSFLVRDTRGLAVDANSSSPSKRSTTITTTSTTKNNNKRRVVDSNIVPGQPLPKNGACDHYHHSYRWFRFQCCGKAFPCDVCHDKSDCERAGTGVFASKMICGFCSKEQSINVKQCECGNQVGTQRVTSRHWEGGKGCRNVLFMSQTDRQKFRGLNKTSSNKSSRVGAEAKQRRDAKNTGDQRH